MEGVMTMMTRAYAIGFLAILAMPLAANAQTAGKTETITRSPPKRVAVHISDKKSERLALQLRFCFEVRALSGSLVSSAPE
jgi:hypothetical protein